MVNTGKPPARMMSSRLENGKTTSTRPVAHTRRCLSTRVSGDINDAANFVCTNTKPGYK